MFRTSPSLIAGPLIALGLGYSMHQSGLEPAACYTAAIAALCAVWWICEPIPLPATSLIPFVAFPLAGVLTHKQVANSYGHSLILLMLAGSFISAAMERTGAHRRVALGMVRLVGGGEGRRLVLGVLAASALLSMWISNTATALMLLPVGLGVIQHAKDQRLTVPLLLAIAYGGSIGGSGTPIGTPPNLIALGTLEEGGITIDFVDWMRFALPVVCILLPITWLWLIRKLPGDLRVSVPSPGIWRPEEVRVMVVFAITAIAWSTRTQPFGGWSGLLGVDATVGDSTVALLAACSMFIIPRGGGLEGGLLDWETAEKIPWGVFVIMGGGLAIGQAFGASGLREVLGSELAWISVWPLLAVMLMICLCGTFLTEVSSNTAVANILMPILFSAGEKSGIEPAMLMIPATFGLNCAFMLPVATPPNAIVYGSGHVSIGQMAREGVVLNVIGSLVIATVCYFLLTGS